MGAAGGGASWGNVMVASSGGGGDGDGDGGWCSDGWGSAGLGGGWSEAGSGGDDAAEEMEA